MRVIGPYSLVMLVLQEVNTAIWRVEWHFEVFCVKHVRGADFHHAVQILEVLLVIRYGNLNAAIKQFSESDNIYNNKLLLIVGTQNCSVKVPGSDVNRWRKSVLFSKYERCSVQPCSNCWYWKSARCLREQEDKYTCLKRKFVFVCVLRKVVVRPDLKIMFMVQIDDIR